MLRWPNIFKSLSLNKNTQNTILQRMGKVFWWWQINELILAFLRVYSPCVNTPPCIFTLFFSFPLVLKAKNVTLGVHPRCNAGAEQEAGRCGVLLLLGCSVLSCIVIFLAIVPPAISTVTVSTLSLSATFPLIKSEQPPTLVFLNSNQVQKTVSNFRTFPTQNVSHWLYFLSAFPSCCKSILYPESEPC